MTRSIPHGAAVRAKGYEPEEAGER